MSKNNRRKIEEDFIEAKNNWDLEKLYIDLASAKGKALTPVEKKFLRGLLCGFSPAEIANKVYKTRSSSTVRVYLSNGLYKYIEEMLSKQATESIKVKSWSRVTQLLEKAGYKKAWLQIESATSTRKKSAEVLPKVKTVPAQDWGEATDTSIFYGRTKELTQVKKWILQDRKRLVVLLGMGGVGKTTFSVKLAEQVKENFDFIIWRSLRFAPSPQVIFNQLLEFFSLQTLIQEKTISASISSLISCLRSSRILIVLDEFDSILYSKNNYSTEEYSQLLSTNSNVVGNSNLEGVPQIQYLPGYEAFGEFIQRLGESQHQSCLLLTSREKPQEIAALEGEILPVRSLKLTGLNQLQTSHILQSKGFAAVKEEESKQIMDTYDGNPLFIKLVATAIHELFAGKIDEFLQQETVVFGNIRSCLDEQFNRLSGLEKQILYLLALNHDFDLDKLQKKLRLRVSQRLILEAVELLQRRCLIERKVSAFSLTPVLKEYLIEKLIEKNLKFSQEEASSLLFAHTIFEKQLKNHLKVNRLNAEL
ncbi:MAG: NB-ARC domain-containing protein [Cyanobacteriota bacterium]|nr:NB-ARC domain-containing protein [Cyanobacteriota bacterium]